MIAPVTQLGDKELEAVADLERRVVAADGGRLKLEWGVLRNRDGERVNDILWWEGAELAGFAGVYAFGGPIEIAGMVAPDLRRRAIGTALLEHAKLLTHERGRNDALLIVPRTTPAGPAFAAAHGGTRAHSEHYLVLGRTPDRSDKHEDVIIRDAATADRPQLARILSIAFDEELPDDPMLFSSGPDTRQLVFEQHGDIIGGMRLHHDGDRTGIYGFAIAPPLQGRGIGRSVLGRVCRSLRELGDETITLEVEVENDHALGLYTSLGFERRATEDYFKIPTT